MVRTERPGLNNLRKRGKKGKKKRDSLGQVRKGGPRLVMHWFWLQVFVRTLRQSFEMRIGKWTLAIPTKTWQGTPYWVCSGHPIVHVPGIECARDTLGASGDKRAITTLFAARRGTFQSSGDRTHTIITGGPSPTDAPQGPVTHGSRLGLLRGTWDLWSKLTKHKAPSSRAYITPAARWHEPPPSPYQSPTGTGHPSSTTAKITPTRKKHFINIWARSSSAEHFWLPSPVAKVFVSGSPTMWHLWFDGRSRCWESHHFQPLATIMK